jgi:hypothetical protein
MGKMSMTCAEKLSPHDEKDEVKHDADLAAPAAISLLCAALPKL